MFIILILRKGNFLLCLQWLLISKSMLREGGDTFLDNLTLDDLSGWICKKVVPVENDGESFVKALLGV